jgi:aminomethyltransferase
VAKSAPPPLARTPLFDLALAQNARLTAFAGWEMPVQYGGLKQEHEAVRKAAGMFDISHMGKFFLVGKAVLESLQFLVPSDLERLQSGQAQYTVFLNARGGIIDDIIVYYQGEGEGGEQQVIIIVNAATVDKDREWLLSHLPEEIDCQDLSWQQVLLAVQGPQTLSFLQPLVAEDLSQVKAFGHLTGTVLGEPAFLARTGYTGEDGFEIMAAPELGKKLWQSLLEAGVTPCGLGARDTLRLEAAMHLYGQDMDDTTTPLEAGLGWLVHLESKGDFMGRSILERQKREGVSRRLVGLQMAGRHIARHGYPVVREGEVVGEVTSGTLSPTLGKAIALAYVPTALSKVGQSLGVEIRGKIYPATVVKKPFYRSSQRPPAYTANG